MVNGSVTFFILLNIYKLNFHRQKKNESLQIIAGPIIAEMFSLKGKEPGVWRYRASG